MPSRSSLRLSPAAAVICGGLVIGSFDGAYAAIFWAFRNVSPVRVFQGVASGLLGRESAVGGGIATAALGLGLHFFIAVTIATVYWIASRWLTDLVRRPFIWGPLYGLAVYGFMNYVVIPLSLARRPAPVVLWIAMSLVVHAFLVGLPAALFARAARSSSARMPVVPDKVPEQAATGAL